MVGDIDDTASLRANQVQGVFFFFFCWGGELPFFFVVFILIMIIYPITLGSILRMLMAHKYGLYIKHSRHYLLHSHSDLPWLCQ